jgi:3-oxoacyl-[acyl-carrier protein] reductase
VTYASAKGTVHVLTMGWSKELAPDKIRVNAVAPGVLETPFHEGQLTPERWVEIAKTTPLLRNGTAEDIVGACIMMASDASAFMTGETIDINGGRWFH